MCVLSRLRNGRGRGGGHEDARHPARSLSSASRQQGVGKQGPLDKQPVHRRALAVRHDNRGVMAPNRRDRTLGLYPARNASRTR